MKKALLLAAAVAALVPSAMAAQPAQPAAQQPVPPVQRIRPSKIILIGDSTAAVIGGWGPSFCAFHVTSAAACLNLAR
ncbi:MAG TPA: lysophospholipase, partial [Allosphingosinicella sp.]